MEEKQILRHHGDTFIFDKPKDKNGKFLDIGDKCRWRWITGTINKFILSKNTLEVDLRFRNGEKENQCVNINPNILEKIEFDTWEKILSDSELNVFEYFNKYPEVEHKACSQGMAMYMHLFKRCKKLAGVEE